MNRSTALVALAALTAFQRTAYSQGAQQTEQQTVETTEGQKRQTQTEAEAAQAAKEARVKKTAEGGSEVNYEQILADPDNVELSFQWARQQVRDGDVKGASATLERILLVKPSLSRARLLYAVVLYRLDDLNEAERQLDILESIPIPDDVKKEAVQYRKLVVARKRSTHYNALLGFGWAYDTNKNAAPSNGLANFGGTLIQLTPSSLRRDDTSMIVLGTLGANHDLGTQAGHQVFGSVTYYQAEQTLLKNLNIKAYSARAGTVLKHWYANVTPSLVFDHVQLAQTTFLRTRGADLKVEHKIDRRSDMYLQSTYQYQGYSPTAVVPTALDRNGNQWDFGAGYGYWLTANNRIAPSIDYQIKNAVKLYYAYNRWTLGLEDTWLTGRGTFLLTSVTANYDRYIQPDFALAPWSRNDDTYRLRATFGAPLSLVYKPLQDFLGTFTYEYYHALSTLSNYSYDNTKILAMVTYTWGY